MIKIDDLKINLKKIKHLDDLVYDAIVIGTKHNEHKTMLFEHCLNESAIIIDIHGVSLYSDHVIL